MSDEKRNGMTFDDFRRHAALHVARIVGELVADTGVGPEAAYMVVLVRDRVFAVGGTADSGDGTPLQIPPEVVDLMAKSLRGAIASVGEAEEPSVVIDTQTKTVMSVSPSGDEKKPN